MIIFLFLFENLQRCIYNHRRNLTISFPFRKHQVFLPLASLLGIDTRRISFLTITSNHPFKMAESVLHEWFHHVVPFWKPLQPTAGPNEMSIPRPVLYHLSELFVFKKSCLINRCWKSIYDSTENLEKFSGSLLAYFLWLSFSQLKTFLCR